MNEWPPQEERPNIARGCLYGCALSLAIVLAAGLVLAAIRAFVLVGH
jgi:hypothetical protein